MASLAAALLVTSSVLAGVWFAAIGIAGIQHPTFIVARPPRWPSTNPTTLTVSFARVDLQPAELAIGLMIGGLLCAGLIWWIWTSDRFGSGRIQDKSDGSKSEEQSPVLQWIMLAAWTAATLLLLFSGLLYIRNTSFSPGEQRYMFSALLMFCIGVQLAASLRTVRWFEAKFGRKPVLDSEGLVNVRCPGCGYSLIGLRELRCPECGLQFTIDELIKAQRYAAAPSVSTTTSDTPT